MMAAPSLARRTFNDHPQCLGLALASQGAYLFLPNVAHAGLILVRPGVRVAPQAHRL